MLGPDKQVGRYPRSGRFYKNAVPVALDLEGVASGSRHRYRLADFNDGQVIERGVDLGYGLLLGKRGQAEQASETETQDSLHGVLLFSLRAKRGQLTGARCAFTHRVPSP